MNAPVIIATIQEEKMAVLKNTTQGNYTVVSQNIMRDKNLTLSERGMLLTLLSLPDNWHLTIRGLNQILPDGKDKISKILNSLIDKGYVTREQNRGKHGKFDSTNLVVHESPINQSDIVISPGNIVADSSPCPENPDTVKRDSVDRDTENPPQYITNKSNRYKDNNKQVRKEDTLTDSEYNDLVSEFGRSLVDHQIKRITDHCYKGCYNRNTIRTWCMERLKRPVSTEYAPPKNISFSNFSQRSYDYAALERDALGHPERSTTDCAEATA